MENWSSETKHNSNTSLSLPTEVQRAKWAEESSDIILWCQQTFRLNKSHHKPSTIHAVRPSKLDLWKFLTWNIGENLDHECSLSPPCRVVIQPGRKLKWIIFNIIWMSCITLQCLIITINIFIIKSVLWV